MMGSVFNCVKEKALAPGTDSSVILIFVKVTVTSSYSPHWESLAYSVKGDFFQISKQIFLGAETA